MLDGRQLHDVDRWFTDKLLQEHHVEDVVNTHPRRQHQTIGERLDTFLHLELARPLVGDGCGEALVQAKPHPFPPPPLNGAVLVVVLSLHDLLGVQHVPDVNTNSSRS